MKARLPPAPTVKVRWKAVEVLPPMLPLLAERSPWPAPGAGTVALELQGVVEVVVKAAGQVADSKVSTTEVLPRPPQLPATQTSVPPLQAVQSAAGAAQATQPAPESTESEHSSPQRLGVPMVRSSIQPASEPSELLPSLLYSQSSVWLPAVRLAVNRVQTPAPDHSPRVTPSTLKRRKSYPCSELTLYQKETVFAVPVSASETEEAPDDGVGPLLSALPPV